MRRACITGGAGFIGSNLADRLSADGVEVVIDFRDKNLGLHTYYYDLHPRDLEHPQFPWTFQRYLYDCMHDYLVEMFVRTPQNRDEQS